ncbi:DUF4351 domain-containing protein [Duganella sp. BuS-21]|uniref:DUF4351 domain-containing protein n=1 Tax=Duganella sp. BuS-21 TaxID=2943848 RepID=UPI0035A6AD82
MAFFFVELGTQIDWSKRPRFRDKELAGIGFGDDPAGLVADKLVEVCMHDGSQRWVLIHIEVQAQRDASLAARVFDYNYRIFKQYHRPVTSLVVLADDDPHWRPHLFHVDQLGTAMSFSFATAKLLDYAGRSDALLVSHNPFALVTLAHLRTQQARHNSDQLYAAKWQLTKLLYEHRWSKRRIIELFNVINWMMVLPAPYQERYWQAIRRLEKERKMEWISPLAQSFLEKGLKKGIKQGLQDGLKKGREQGLKKGLEEGLKKGQRQGIEQGIEQGMEQGVEQGMEQGRGQGRREGAAALLERLLTRRFGVVSATARRKLAEADLTQLEAWSDALPEVQSLKQLFEKKPSAR